LSFERPGPFRSYFFSKKDLLHLERYAWYVPNKDVPRLEQDRLRLGNASASAWICHALNEWIGCPQGLPTSEDVQRKAGGALDRTFGEAVSDAPYWGIFETDAAGQLTGRIWMSSPGRVPLFGDRGAADAVLGTLPASDGEATTLGRSGTNWSVRGVTRDALARMRSAEPDRFFRASVGRKGQLTLEPLK
jgi:hypothetical protein